MYKNIADELREINSRVSEVLKQDGIKRFRLVSLGNSIASGYSMVRSIKPLLLRNIWLYDTMYHKKIKLELHHFARAQNNNDEHVYEWLVNNTMESEIHKLNRFDYSCNGMVTHGINQEIIEDYYPIHVYNDIGLSDCVTECDDELANVIVYNGGTGSFLDNLTRGGKINCKLMYGINRDTYGLEAILKYIQTSNRKNHSNTQVYLCGAPNILGLNLSNFINLNLKSIAKKYSNVVYVEPVKSKLFYKELENKKSGYKLDIHYDEKEYLKFNKNIMNSINDNYMITKAMIEIDRKLYEFSSEIEFNKDLYDQNYIWQRMNMIIICEACKLIDRDLKMIFYEKLNDYLMNRLPYDFYYIGKENVKTFFKQNKF